MKAATGFYFFINFGFATDYTDTKEYPAFASYQLDN